MIIIHASYWDERFFLWGEVPPNLSVTKPSRNGKYAKVQQSPYDAGKDHLLPLMQEIGFKAKVSDFTALIAWLPTENKKPLPSSSIIDEANIDKTRDGEEIDLAPWKVTALQMNSADIIKFLSSSIDKKILAHGILLGKEMIFWTMILRFAGALVEEQKFLPGIKKVNKEYLSLWKPVFLEDDVVRLAKFANGMPHICVALNNDPGALPLAPGPDTLSSFIGLVVDELIRSSIPKRDSLVFTSGWHPEYRYSVESIHDLWLHSLSSEEKKMEWNKKELEKFYKQVFDWERPVHTSISSPFRLYFRLEESIDSEEDGVENSSWFVRYLLQDSIDPSLMVDAKNAWAPDAKTSSVFKRRGFTPREYLFSSLGEASRICSRIENSLSDSMPGGYMVDTNAAYEFLLEKAPLLQQAGFGVLLPSWWTGKGTKLKLRNRARIKSPKMQGGGVLSLNEVVNFDWEIAIGDETLSRKELDELVQMKSSLVKVRGQWVELTSDGIEKARKLLKQKSAKLTLREVMMISLGGDGGRGIGWQEEIVADGWIGEFLSQLSQKNNFKELPTPKKFQGSLRPYQLRGYSWLNFLAKWGLGACLADDMGLGKTIQTLALIQNDYNLNEKRPVLIICPTSVVGNWYKESQRFTPGLPVMIHHGSSRKKDSTFKKEALKNAIVISSYSLLQRDVSLFNEVSWGGVILDEAQNIKNPETKQARAARSIKSGYRLALTGTPVENNVGELWSILEFLNPSFLGTQNEFKSNFFLPIQIYKNKEAAEKLKSLTGPFILRRLKTDKTIIQDLPDKMEMKVFCTLTKEQASLYEAIVKDTEDALESAEGIKRKGLILATLSKLKQVCNHPAHFLSDNSIITGRSGKVSRMEEMIEEILEVRDRALIFTQFKEMGDILKKHLEETFGVEVLFLHGGVPKKQRDIMVEKFQNKDVAPIFILSLKAGGTGLNLTSANHVFHFDRWWNPAVENQATDRAFRIGQTKNVEVHKFLCVGTLEEKIDEMIEKKKEVASNVVGTGEGWLTELSTKELKELFTLRKEAFGDY